MKEITTVVTRKGQVTVPVEIRRQLGVQRGDKMTFGIENGQVWIKRSSSVVERTAGAFKGYGPVLSPEQLRDAAEGAIAEEAIERPHR